MQIKNTGINRLGLDLNPTKTTQAKPNPFPFKLISLSILTLSALGTGIMIGTGATDPEIPPTYPSESSQTRVLKTSSDWEPVAADVLPVNVLGIGQETAVPNDAAEKSASYAEVVLSNEQKRWAAKISSRFRIAPEAAAHIIASVDRQAPEYGIPPSLLLAIIGVESSFNPYAYSEAGAIGLVQALPRAHPHRMENLEKSGNHVLEIDSNIRMGASILSEYLRQQKGNVPNALQKYNGSLNDKTRTYANKVNRMHQSLFGRPVPSTVRPRRINDALTASEKGPNIRSDS
jgi:hypothetical protein